MALSGEHGSFSVLDGTPRIQDIAAISERFKQQIPRGSTVMPHLYRERPDPDDPARPDLNSQIVGRAIAIGINAGLFSNVLLVTDCRAEGNGPIAPREEAYIKSLLDDTSPAANFVVRSEAQTTRQETRVFRRLIDEQIHKGHPATHLVDVALSAHIPRVRNALAQPKAFGIEAHKVQIVSAEDIIIAFGSTQDLAFLAQQMQDPAYQALSIREQNFVYGHVAQGPFGGLADWYASTIDRRKGTADRANKRALRRVQQSLATS